jgi:hypothetical protein
MNLNTNHYDRRNLAPRKKDRANTAEPARTRPGQTYPGGKHMRKALAKLALRNTRSTQPGRHHQAGEDFYAPGSPSRQLAGSMNGRK